MAFASIKLSISSSYLYKAHIFWFLLKQITATLLSRETLRWRFIVLTFLLSTRWKTVRGQMNTTQQLFLRKKLSKECNFLYFLILPTCEINRLILSTRFSTVHRTASLVWLSKVFSIKLFHFSYEKLNWAAELSSIEIQISLDRLGSEIGFLCRIIY